MKKPFNDSGLERWLAAIVESSDDAIISKDLNGIITSWNEGATRIFGYSSDEVMGKSITVLIPPDRDNEEPEILERIRKGELVDHYETMRRRKDGSLVEISLTVSPVIDESGKIVGASKIARDITARKEAERQLLKRDVEREELLERERQARQAADEANRLKDEFLATLSHELRNPLNVILGYAEVLLRNKETQQSQFVSRAAQVMRKNALAQSQLIGDLLDLSRLRMGKLSVNPESVSLAAIICNAVETVRNEAAAKKVALIVEMPEEVLFVHADPLRLEQVVWNLLNNAVKFTPAEGTVTISLRSEQDEAILAVKDTGEGIDPKFVPHVFEMFRQADASNRRAHGGLGIGLALVAQLIKLQGGSVEAFSAGSGKGAIFTVRVPLSVESRVSELSQRAQETEHLNHLRVLVVDDSEDTVEMLRHLLEARGAIVSAAKRAAEALELAAEKGFDLIVSDVSMPAMDGFELLRALRANPRTASIPAIALTGFSRNEDAMQARQAGFFAHVAKPLDTNKLIRVILAAVNNREARSPKPLASSQTNWPAPAAS